MPPSATILCDKAEKKPLIFPTHLVVAVRGPDLGATTTIRLHTLTAALPTGDYLLESQPQRLGVEVNLDPLDGTPRKTAVERKGSLAELAHYVLTADGRRRLHGQLTRLSHNFEFPWLVLEGTPQTLTARGRTVKLPGLGLFDPGLVLDRFFDMLATYPRVRLQTHPCSSYNDRVAMGEWVARLLLARPHQEGQACPPHASSFPSISAPKPPAASSDLPTSSSTTTSSSRT